MANKNRQAVKAALEKSILGSPVELILMKPTRMSAMALKTFTDNGWIKTNAGTAAVFEASARFGWMLQSEKVEFTVQTASDEFIDWFMDRVAGEIAGFRILTDVMTEDDLYIGTVMTHVGPSDFEATVSKKRRTILEFVGDEGLREFVQSYIRPF